MKNAEESLEKMLQEFNANATKVKSTHSSGFYLGESTLNETDLFADAEYIQSTRTGLIHLKGCKYLEATYKGFWQPVYNFSKSDTLCESCKKKLYIKKGAKDGKNLHKYIKIFHEHHISKDVVKEFYMEKGAKTEIRGNSIYVQVKEEYWRIDIFGEDEVYLYHNNYQKSNQGQDRYNRPGYHQQQLKQNRLYHAMISIIRYSYSANHKSYNMDLTGDI